MKMTFSLRRLSRVLSLALPLTCAVLGSAHAAVVISQAYGAGGNNGATLKNDFVELFNNGTASVTLTGYSLQYASSTGASWTVSALPSLTLAPGQYMLVKQAAGTGGTVDLPTPDATGTLSMGGSAGKVALVASTTALAGTSPTGADDLVSYSGLSATQAYFRADGGCGSTFAAATANPRNSATALAPCSGSGGGGSGGGGSSGSLVKIYDIQGTGSTSTMAGTALRAQGVVTRVNNTGFFMQDPVGDGNPLTSDGIFVYTGSTVYSVATPGTLVEVSGTVTEFAGATQIGTVTAVTSLGSGTITPTVVTLPVAAVGDLERYEGMLVTLQGSTGAPLTVNQNYFQGRYGQITIGAGRQETPTNRYRPGTAQAIALADLNARSRIVMDDGSRLQNANPIPYLGTDGAQSRAGNTLASLTGVIDQGMVNTSGQDYKIHPTETPAFVATNPRTSAPPDVGGNLRVASFNVLNFFTTFTNGATADGQTGQGCSLGTSVAAGNCRGADSATEFSRQRAKIVEAISAINADALGLMEIQNNGATAVGNLVSALNAKLGAGTYAYVADPSTGTGTDAIKTAIIYKPAKLALQGASVSDTDAINSRPTLAQTFRLANGEKFTLVVNHLKSKGSCPSSDAANIDTGDGQGCWNGLRVQQAQRLRTFVATLQSNSGSNDVVLVGDFNAYGKEDPIYELTSNGYVDQIAAFNAFEYSYVFDGAAGYLDHAITSASLAPKVAYVTHWHINADESLIIDYNVEWKAPLTTCGAAEGVSPGTVLCPPDPTVLNPYRSSDHDPVVMGLNLYKTITGTSGRDTLVGTAGDDYIWGGVGADTLTGNGGKNVYGYASVKDAGDTITDFVPGTDRIDLRLVMTEIGYSGATPVTSGHVRLVAVGSDTAVQIDSDGSAGASAPRTLVTLKNVSPAALVASRDLIVQ